MACLIWASPSLLVDAHTLVAIRALLRRPCSASPSSCSAAPYIGEESKKVTSTLSAISTRARAFFFISAPPRASKVRQVPMPITGTCSPLCPSIRCSMQSPLSSVGGQTCQFFHELNDYLLMIVVLVYTIISVGHKHHSSSVFLLCLTPQHLRCFARIL